jgi:hypothetical protein
MPKLTDYTEELKWLQQMAKEQATSDDKALAKRYQGVNFFQGLWGYKEVGLFLGIAPKTVLTPEFRLRLPALSMWQAKGGKGKAGQQVLRWRPIEVMRWRQEKEEQVKRRLQRVV